ncbi:hypothetical protein NDU88_002439 [Pleurodeles waltl]|uniref:Uncharacterized protein n=1 Tax=Pleurodeles waltl TaxID=8319 RepID=A0AAV7WNH8_PLEWA|nr:hypothetical protein NDU88_002439 [Pleurodeles waltl]
MRISSPAALPASQSAPREPLRSPVGFRWEGGCLVLPAAVDRLLLKGRAVAWLAVRRLTLSPQRQSRGRPQARGLAARLRRAWPGSLRAPPALGSPTRVSTPDPCQFAPGGGLG